MRRLQKARALGASGSFAIHPNQVEILNRVFAPTVEEFSEAQEIVRLVQQASQKGDAIATRNGKMLDEPVVARAQSTITRRERFTKSGLTEKKHLVETGAFPGSVLCAFKIAADVNFRGVGR